MVFPPTELLSYIVELRVFSLLYPFHLIHHQVLLAYFPNVFQIHPLLSISANVTIVQAPTSSAQITAKVYNWYSCFYSFGSSCHLSYFPSSLRTKWTLQGLLSLWSWSCLWTITYHSSLHSLPQAAGFLFCSLNMPCIFFIQIFAYAVSFVQNALPLDISRGWLLLNSVQFRRHLFDDTP